MASSNPSAAHALQVLIAHIRDWSHYYEQGRQAAKRTLDGQKTMLDRLDQADPEYEPLGRMYMRSFAALETFEYIAGEMADIAQIAYAKVAGKGKIRNEAAARRRLRMVVNLISEGLLRFAYDQVSARRMHARAAQFGDLADFDPDILRRLEAATKAESSQRLLALEHVVNNVGPIVLAFAEQFPETEN